MSAQLPALRRCKCGSTPTFYAKMHRDVWQLRLKCVCGNHGACLLYRNLEDEPMMQQAAIDGWNLADD